MDKRVLVAGGGPVGSTAAWLLARQGVPVTLVEAEEGVQIDYRASTFHPPTLDLLEESGITQALLDRGLVLLLQIFNCEHFGVQFKPETTA